MGLLILATVISFATFQWVVGLILLFLCFVHFPRFHRAETWLTSDERQDLKREAKLISIEISKFHSVRYLRGFFDVKTTAKTGYTFKYGKCEILDFSVGSFEIRVFSNADKLLGDSVFLNEDEIVRSILEM